MPQLQSPVYNAPMALDDSLIRTRGMDPARAVARNRQMVEDIVQQTLGPMPVRMFIDEFLKIPLTNHRSGLLSSRNAFWSVPSSASTPSEIYEPLVAALNKRTQTKSRCPGFTFHDTSSRVISPRKLAYMKPSICCYTAQNLRHIIASDAESRTELGYAELLFEVKADPSHDFFVDPPDIPDHPGDADTLPHDLYAERSESSTYESAKSRAYGQHINYVAEMFARQHRVFAFTVSLSGSRARLLRWDRAGCIVSTSFDIREEPELLCEFLYRFSQANGEERGHDPTVTVASPAEETLFAHVIRDYVREQTDLHGAELGRAVSEHYHLGHVTVVDVLDKNTPTPDGLHSFIVSRPVISPLYLTGRGTRGWWAVDTRTSRVVFLKDTWRLWIHNEGDIVTTLHEKGVHNVPSLVCYGDVPDRIPDPGVTISEIDMQCSMTNEYLRDPWVCHVRGTKAITVRHLHYRIVFGTVGYGLKHLRGTEELLHASHDVFRAMKDAYTLASYIHRDISIGNVIMVREQGNPIRKGYLIDWDASCKIGEDGEAVEPGRAGTWIFTSIRMLSHLGLKQRHKMQDDMESLFYLVLYCALLWLPHNLSDDQLATTFKQYFDEAHHFGSILEGGNAKIANALGRETTAPIEFNPALKEWVDTVLDYSFPQGELYHRYRQEKKWEDPDQLDAFWTDFLQRHTLPRDDRCVHNHPYAKGQWEYSGRFRSTEAISLRVRRSDGDGERGQPARKKSRCATIIAATSSHFLRRSERIRDKQDRAAKDPVHPAPTKSSRPTTRTQTARRGTSRRR